MSIEEKIGMKIRNLRNQNGLTQEELADRTELTKGFISQLERGLTAPSVSTLLDIVECLGTNLSDFSTMRMTCRSYFQKRIILKRKTRTATALPG